MQTKESLPQNWMPMSMFPPEPCETYEVRLPDSSVQRAFWSGKVWWLQGKSVAPIGWRLLASVVAAA